MPKPGGGGNTPPNSGSAAGSYAFTATAGGTMPARGAATGGYTLMATSSGTAPAVETAATPVIASDFEAGVAPWSAWYGCTVSQSTVQAHDGAASMAIAATSANIGIQTDNWPGFAGVAGGVDYDIAAALYGKSGMTLTLKLTWRQGSTDLRVDTLPVTTSGAWATATGRFTAPAGADTLYVTGESGTASSGQTYYFDSFTVTEATSTSGPPPSGSAAGGFTFTGTAAGVTVHGGDGSGTFTFSAAATGSTPQVGANSGSAAGTITWTATAAGRRASSGNAAASIAWAPAATGHRASRGAASGSFAYASTASGSTPAVTPHAGRAAGSYAFTATATGSSKPKRDIAITTSPIATSWSTIGITASPLAAAAITTNTAAAQPVTSGWSAGAVYLEGS